MAAKWPLSLNRLKQFRARHTVRKNGLPMTMTSTPAPAWTMVVKGSIEFAFGWIRTFAVITTDANEWRKSTIECR
jgi:hypothetical protein